MSQTPMAAGTDLLAPPDLLADPALSTQRGHPGPPCPGSIVQRPPAHVTDGYSPGLRVQSTPRVADAWIPVTRTGMTAVDVVRVEPSRPALSGRALGDR